MKTCDTIEDTMEYIRRKHKINSRPGGVHGYLSFRKSNGSRTIFQEIRGFRIFSHKAFDDNTLLLETLALGYQLRGKRQVTVSSKLFLPKLAMINVYDHRSEFFSYEGLDFSYSEEGRDAELNMLREWMNNDAGILRAQWSMKDDATERILEEISMGRKIEQVNRKNRFVDVR